VTSPQLHSSKVDKNRIISSDPTQKAEVAAIVPWISCYPVVPSVLPWMIIPAKLIDVAKDLRKKGFTVHQVKESSTSVAKGEILDQDVDAGKKWCRLTRRSFSPCLKVIQAPITAIVAT
jgi:hypothetical protein